MKRVRFVMVGGFLGAGKTTTIARIARHYMDSGLKVGLVTNDQAFDLVDTLSLRAQGFDVGEVPGACFCCKFDDLVDTVAELTQEQAPDVVITEPVGSCTDLVATVIEPLSHLHGEQYEIAPLVVLLKPEHGLKILREEQGGGFSPKAAYIFLKQLEEADTIVINKVDKIPAEQQDELKQLIQSRFPGRSVVLHSAKTGEGFDDLVAQLSANREARSAFMEVDYDVYAEGEAELGWLNATFELSANKETVPLDSISVSVVERCRRDLKSQGLEPAHLKVLTEASGHMSLANLVGSDVEVEQSFVADKSASEVKLTVNARVAGSPEELSQIVDQTVAAVASELEMTSKPLAHQSFRPGRPTPTHRMGASG
ncbi:MAG: GTP-binding protein [Planctomycetota bacterium]